MRLVETRAAVRWRDAKLSRRESFRQLDRVSGPRSANDCRMASRGGRGRPAPAAATRSGGHSPPGPDDIVDALRVADLLLLHVIDSAAFATHVAITGRTRAAMKTTALDASCDTSPSTPVRTNTRPRFPSTPGQLVLLRLLADELRELGLDDVQIDEYGYVMATIPATSDSSPTCADRLHRPRRHLAGDARRRRQADRAPRRRRPRPGAARRSERRPARSPTTRRSPSRSATTSSPRRARRCWAPTTRPASRKSSRRPSTSSPIRRFRTARFASRSRRTRKSAAARTTSTSPLRRRVRLHARRRRPRRARIRELLRRRASPSRSTASTRTPATRRGAWSMRSSRRRLHRLAFRSDALSPETTDGYEGICIRIRCRRRVDRTTVRVLVRDFDRAASRRRRRSSRRLAREAARAASRVVARRRGRGVVPEHEGGARAASAGRRVRARRRFGAPASSRSSGPSAAAPTARGCRSWGCRRRTSSPASTTSTRGWSGSSVQDMDKAVEVIVHLCGVWAATSP